MPYKETKVEKLYYSIGEVAEMFHVNTSLIRFWEKEFDIIKPKKNKKGNRLFTKEDIDNFHIIYHLVKDYDLVVNVYRASVTPEEEGYLVLDVTGSETNIEKALDYIRGFNVTINTTGKGVTRDDQRCIHCGHCVPHCPTGALRIPNPATRESLAEFQQQPPSGDDPTGVRIMFNNLPAARNVISIFTTSGDLVDSIDHDGRLYIALENGQLLCFAAEN